jgi:hypothetical protein
VNGNNRRIDIMPQLNNVTVQYCNIVEPQTDYIDPGKVNDEGYWGITLGPLTPDQEEYLAGLGLSHLVNNGQEYSPHISMKQKVLHPKTGEPNDEPMYVDMDNNPVNVDLGSGSTANVAFATYEGYQNNVYILLQGVQAKEIVASTSGKFKGFTEVA